MATKQEREKEKDDFRNQRDKLTALIGDKVIHALGKPNGLQRVQVRQLWGECYRVNILIGSDIASAKISNSFFVVVDSEGKIVESTPQITRQF
jgi:hypothetical protein